MSPPPFIVRLGHGLSRRREWIWAPLLMSFVTFWLYRSVWIPASGQAPQWFGGRTIESFWPDLSYLAGALRHGEWPAWNPYDRGGYAFHADPEAGIFYPLNWLFVVPGAVLGSMPGWVIQLKVLLQVAIAGTLMHAYLRTRRLPAPAAALAGVVLIGSMPWVTSVVWASAQGWPLAWAPLVWMATDRLIERAREPGGWRRAAALAGSIGIAGSAGSPAGLFELLLIGGGYGAWRLGVTMWNARGPGARGPGARLRAEVLAQVRGLAMAGAATLALLLVVVLPGLSLAVDSPRQALAAFMTVRHTTVVALLLAVGAAHGLAGLLAEDARARRRALIVLAGAVVAAAVGVMYVDTASFGQPLLRAREAPVDDQEDRRFLAGFEDVTHDWRIYDEFVMAQRPGSRLRVRDFRGEPAGDPSGDERYTEILARLVRNPELLGAYNVRYVLHGAHRLHGKTENHIPQAPVNMRPQHFRKLDARRFELVGAAPLVLWYGAATVVDRRRALEHVVMQEATPGGRRVAVVEAADVPAGARDALARLSAGPVVQKPPAPVPGGLLSYGANRVAVSVTAPAEGIVVLNEKYAPGWNVEVDGRAAAPVRVNYLLRGVVVPAGTHRVVWSYAPRGHAALVGLWAAGVAFLLVAGGSWLRERRRSVAGVTPAGAG